MGNVLLWMLVLFCVAFIIFAFFKILRLFHLVSMCIVTMRFQTKDADVAHFAQEVIDFIEKDERKLTLSWKLPEWMEKL